MDKIKQPVRIAIFSVFFFSGMCGLIYQIVWTRMLALVFGNTMLAVSTVLCAFMAGMAAGSYFIGNYIDKKPKSLLRLYAVLEVGIGVFALLFPWLSAAFTPLYTAIYQVSAEHLLLLNLVRFAACFLLIAIPTFLMGATLPPIIKYFSHSPKTIGKNAGLLYGINTLGAVAGTVFCGFFLLKTLGMQKSTWLAALINFSVAAIAWNFGKTSETLTAETSVSLTNQPAEAEAYPKPVIRAVFIGIGLSGFCALAYEVFWTRMLNLFFHNTIYSFTTMLATFLTGIALGSLIYALFVSKFKNKPQIFAGMQIAIGLLCFFTPFMFKFFHAALFSKFTPAAIVLKAVIIMILPTILMGISLPMAMQITQKGTGRQGATVGSVYAVNTIGSILGAFVAGFILIPWLGLYHGITAVTGLNIFSGFLVLFFLIGKKIRWSFSLVYPAVIIILVVLTPANLFYSVCQQNQPDADILLYQEGKIANVLVYDFFKEGYKDFYLNGVEEASSRVWHVQLFKMLGVLPAVVHPQPDNALMIAFGAGISAGACVTQVKEFEVAELNPDISQVAEIFKEENLDVIHQPKFNLIVNDGRNHLLLTQKKYDLIISDATNPLSFDSWTLYTKEFYELCRRRLAENGVFCQWVPIPLPDDAIKIILNTFRSVFPHTSFWSIYGHSQCLMLATPQRLNIDPADLQKRLPEILNTAKLTDYGIHSVEKFLSFFLIGEDNLQDMLAGFNKINTDDLPLAQFLGAQLNQAGLNTTLELLTWQESIEPYLSNPAELSLPLKNTLTAYIHISRLLNLAFLQESDLDLRKARLLAEEKGLTNDENIKSMLNFDSRRKQFFEKRTAEFPTDFNARNSLGYIYFQENNASAAMTELKKAIKLKPDFANALLNLAQACRQAGDTNQAITLFRQLQTLNPTAANVKSLPIELNISHLLKKTYYHPKNSELLLNLAASYFKLGYLREAGKVLHTLSIYYPQDQTILSSLAAYYESLELYAQAAGIYQRLLELKPGNNDFQKKQTEYQLLAKNPHLIAKKRLEHYLAIKSQTEKTAPRTVLKAYDLWNKHPFDGTISQTALKQVAALLEKTIQAQPDYSQAYMDAALIYEILGEYQQAKNLWQKGISKFGATPEAQDNADRLGLLQQIKSEKHTAEEKANLHDQIGFFFWKHDQLEEAIFHFKAAIALKADHVSAWANLGFNYIQAGYFQEAVQAMEHTLTLQPTMEFADKIQQQLARVKELLKQADSAVK